jgi:S-DNA-T family DNA segregation ATPase FtsK/SpoIIIE
LRPEHQRELFALGLITLALVTIIFFITGNAGGIGSIYLLGVQKGFGSGALVVPLALGILGIAILLQERMHEDSRFSGANVLGTLLVLGMVLALLEFPVHDTPMDFRNDKGGGLAGFFLVYLLDAIVGRPAALVVVIMLMLGGILLTFNITLRELLPGMLAWLSNMWAMLWGGARRPLDEQQRSSGKTKEQAQTTYTPLDPADVVLTPIAERPTRASLFRRPQSSEDEDKAEQTEQTPAETASKPSQKSKDTVQPAKSSTSSSAEPSSSDKQDESAQSEEEAKGITQERFEEIDVPTLHLAWPLPSLDILDRPTEDIAKDTDRLTKLARLIEETLGSFKVEAQVVGVNTGPVITQFELQPGVGVKISKITTLEKDLALALAAPSIRLEAPIPGKAAVGIEIPNSAISVVTLYEVIESEIFTANRGKLRIPLGKDVTGVPRVADMTKMPHLLVAGSTGSGKSVAINSFLCGLLLKHTPDELRMIMVDPKMVELIVYNRIPHLLSPVVTELERVVPTLKWATREMERRYKIFARHGCRNLESYQKRTQTRSDLEPMPYILIVIDELADLMMMAPDEVETQICRLAQMARATGIHLIIATQRPSVDVITGLIKANFPSRVAFGVTSQVDSRVIIDAPGAERLLGRGDMLYMSADSAKLIRMQGTFVSDREVEQIVNFWRAATPPEHIAASKQKEKAMRGGDSSSGSDGDGEQRPRAEQRPVSAASARGGSQASQSNRDSYATSSDDAFVSPGGFLSTDEQDTLLPQALELVQQHKRASASLLQRRLRIGYSKAAQLIDLLEQQGVLGPADEGRSREVLERGD